MLSSFTGAGLEGQRAHAGVEGALRMVPRLAQTAQATPHAVLLSRQFLRYKVIN